MSRFALSSWLVVLLTPLLSGCVERIIEIETRPAGATVFLNDQQLPETTPTHVSFLWYGDYDIIVRKDGYETLQTSYRVNPPWWQLPPFDLITEAFIPATIQDVRTVPTLELVPESNPPLDELLDRALETRSEAVE